MLQYISSFKNIVSNRYLIGQLAKRDIQYRYKGSYLGLVWSFLTPLLMLSIYTFVFSVIFKAKWGIESDNKLEFAIILFAGLNTFNMFSETIIRSPSLILENESYVKKVIFPLEILPITVVISTFFNTFVGYLVLIISVLLIKNTLSWTLLLFPIVMIPFILFTLGASWFLASTGVYVRDITNLVGILSTIFLFLSPIFYPISAIPSNLKFYYYLNPITHVVENVRKITIWGQLPSWEGYLIQLLVGLLVMLLGYIWFLKTKDGFIDVL